MLTQFIRYGREMIQRFPLAMRQAAKFGMVGALNTVVDWAVYFILTAALQSLSIAPTLAKGISYTAGILNSFIWNRNWTFRSKSGVVATLLPFVLVNVVGLVINTGTMQLGLYTFKLPEIISLALATAVTLGWNYSMSKFVIFRR